MDSIRKEENKWAKEEQIKQKDDKEKGGTKKVHGKQTAYIYSEGGTLTPSV